VTAEELAEALPGIMGSRKIALDPVFAITLAASMEYVRKTFSEHVTDGRDARLAGVIRAAETLAAALREAKAAGDDIAGSAAVLPLLHHLGKPSITVNGANWTAALALLAGNFQAAIAVYGGVHAGAGHGGPLGRFLSFCAWRIAGARVSPESASRMVKRVESGRRAIWGKALQNNKRNG
jgi:hypothetical protein